MDWKIQKTKKDKIARYEVVQEDVSLPNGAGLNFSYINFTKGVCVLPLLEDGRVICLRQYRHAIRKWQWELPAGMMDVDGEGPLNAAKRELEEETGYQAANWIPLNSFYPSPGSTSEEIHLFAATGLVKTEQRLEETEQIELFTLEMSELYRLIEKGEFQHGAGLAAILGYTVKNEKI